MSEKALKKAKKDSKIIFKKSLLAILISKDMIKVKLM